MKGTGEEKSLGKDEDILKIAASQDESSAVKCCGENLGVQEASSGCSESHSGTSTVQPLSWDVGEGDVGNPLFYSFNFLYI